jgi:hypothetical protein
VKLGSLRGEAHGVAEIANSRVKIATYRRKI